MYTILRIIFLRFSTITIRLEDKHQYGSLVKIELMLLTALSILSFYFFPL